MIPGDMVRSCSADGQVVVLFLGNEIPWNDTFGMIGPQHVFPRGSTGIILDRHVVEHRSNNTFVFIKILTSDGNVGWLSSKWLEVINEPR